MAYRRRRGNGLSMGLYMAHRANIIPGPFYLLIQFFRALMRLGR